MKEVEIHEDVAEKKVHEQVYRGIYGPYNRMLRDKSLEIAKRYYKKGKLLDVGCGDGYSIKLVKKRLGVKDKDYIGLDISATRLSRASKTAKNLICGSAEKLAFANESIDFILFNEVVEHLFKPQNAIDEIYRVLKKGGILLMDFPNEYNCRAIKLLTLHFPINHPGHLGIITPSKIKKWAKGKFNIVFSRTFPFGRMPFALCVNYLMVLRKNSL